MEWSLGAVALGGASLLVPLYVVQLGGSALVLGVLASAAALVGVPSALLAGRMADRTPRLVALVEGALLLILAMLVILPFTSHLGIIVVLNAALWAAFAGAGPVLSLLAVADADESEWQHRIARLHTFQGWGWAVGLTLGTIWLSVVEPRLGRLVALRTYFVLCAGFVAAAALGLAFDAPRGSTLRYFDPRRLRQALMRAPRMNVRGATFPFTPGRASEWAFRTMDPRTLAERFGASLSLYYPAVLLVFAGFAVFFAPVPMYLDAAGFPSGVIFGFYLLTGVGAALSYGMAGRLAAEHGLGTLQCAGLVVRGLAMPAVALVGTLAGAALTGTVLLGGLFAAIGVSWAMVAVTAATLVARLAPDGLRGEALGFYAATSAFGGAVGSMLGGWLAEIGFGLAFGTAGALVLLGASLVVGLPEAVDSSDDGSTRT